MDPEVGGSRSLSYPAIYPSFLIAFSKFSGLAPLRTYIYDPESYIVIALVADIISLLGFESGILSYYC